MDFLDQIAMTYLLISTLVIGKYLVGWVGTQTWMCCHQYL